MPSNAAVETYHTSENMSMNAGFTVRKHVVSIKIKVWIQNLNVSGIL